MTAESYDAIEVRVVINAVGDDEVELRRYRDRRQVGPTEVLGAVEAEREVRLFLRVTLGDADIEEDEAPGGNGSG